MIASVPPESLSKRCISFASKSAFVTWPEPLVGSALDEMLGAFLNARDRGGRCRDLVGVDGAAAIRIELVEAAVDPRLIFGAADRAVVIRIDRVEELLAPFGMAAAGRGSGRARRG